MIIIKNGHVIDPASGTDEKRDIIIKDGKIAAPDSKDFGVPTVIDADGLVVAPGFVDMHVHLRDPGYTYKEDLASGGEAAAAGGITSAVCMANTFPVTDSAEAVRALADRAKTARISIFTYGAVTVGGKGKALTDAHALKIAGAVGLSDDGMASTGSALMREAMKSAKEEHLIISCHCEDPELAGNYAVNEGRVSEFLGITGRPALAEEIMAARDILIARSTGARLHIAHVSAAGTVEMIRMAKSLGVQVTAETCPHYFALTEDAVLAHGAVARVNPPLRTPSDRKAILEGLSDGTIDVIATDHAPHSNEEKSLPLEEAPSGIPGLETALGVALTELYHGGGFSLWNIIRLMSLNPARILGIRKGRLAVGDDADVVIFDPEAEWTVDPKCFKSKGKNTPFAGKHLKGKVIATIAGGKIVYGRE